jgi:hypothetical protein
MFEDPRGWTCGRCGEPQLAQTHRVFIPDPAAPIPGTTIAACPACAAVRDP